MKISYRELKDKILGCWWGKTAGGTIGAPFECYRGCRDLDFYVQDDPSGVPNDDLDLQLMVLRAVEKYGNRIDAHILAEYWLTYVSTSMAEYGAGAGLSSAGEGLAALASALPLTAAGFSALLAVLPDLLANLPQILVFVGIMGAFSLLGPGLAAAGAGILGIGQGLLAMAQSLVTATSGLVSLGGALPLVNAGMLELINGLMNTEINIGGILTFVLLAASMFVMAEAIKSMNEHLGPMVANLGTLGNIFTTGLMVGITVFAVMMLLLSLAMGKVASGVDKVTKSFAAQYSQLQKNIPLLATAAILSNPIVGAITVAVATAAGFAIGAIIPQMAKGGVVASPTVAMVGEGRYPEAVVPLGSSPQFAEMKDDIANAVIQGIFAANRAGGSEKAELVLNLDGEKLARVIIPRINKENNRRGYALQLKEV